MDTESADHGIKGAMVKLMLIMLVIPAYMTAACSDAEEVGDSAMKIRIIAGDTVLTATLEDNAVSRDFASLFPLKLRLKDYAGTEKISDLPQRLSAKTAPAGCDPSVGDITYYAPWGNLAIFYRDFGYADGLVKLGRIDGDGAAQLEKMKGEFDAVFELVEE